MEDTSEEEDKDIDLDDLVFELDGFYGPTHMMILPDSDFNVGSRCIPPIEISFNWASSEWIKIHYVNCVICKEKLHYPEEFPKDFPNEWKMCCACKYAWDYINGLFNTDEILCLDEDIRKRTKRKYRKRFYKVFKLEYDSKNE